MTRSTRHKVLLCVLAALLFGCKEPEFALNEPSYTLGEEGAVEFFFAGPFCILSEACGSDTEFPALTSTEGIGYYFHLSVRAAGGDGLLPDDLSFESSDPETVTIGEISCSSLHCTLDRGCEAEDPDCTSPTGIRQMNIELITLRSGTVELHVLDASGEVYDRTTLTFK